MGLEVEGDVVHVVVYAGEQVEHIAFSVDPAESHVVAARAGVPDPEVVRLPARRRARRGCPRPSCGTSSRARPRSPRSRSQMNFAAPMAQYLVGPARPCRERDPRPPNVHVARRGEHVEAARRRHLRPVLAVRAGPIANDLLAANEEAYGDPVARAAPIDGAVAVVARPSRRGSSRSPRRRGPSRPPR